MEPQTFTSKDVKLGTKHEIEQLLNNIQRLEEQYSSKSRFRRFSRCIEPLIGFLVMYSPAVDMLVQYDVSPSAIVWGSLKALLQVGLGPWSIYYDAEHSCLDRTEFV